MKKSATIPIGLWVFLSVFGSVAGGQVAPQRSEAIRSRLQQTKAFFQKMPEKRRQMLSGAAQNLIQLANVWDKEGPRLPGNLNRPAELPQTSSGPAAPGGVIPVSAPDNDFAFSILTGFTQSETSTAWCGNHVAVGFNDSGSLAESIFFGPRCSATTCASRIAQLDIRECVEALSDPANS
jgi:hypothetical protein